MRKPLNCVLSQQRWDMFHRRNGFPTCMRLEKEFGWIYLKQKDGDIKRVKMKRNLLAVT